MARQKSLFKISNRKNNRFLVLSDDLLALLNTVEYDAGAHYVHTLLTINDARLAPEHTVALDGEDKLLTYDPKSVDVNTLSHRQYLCIKWLLDGHRALDTDVITGIKTLNFGIKQILLNP